MSLYQVCRFIGFAIGSGLAVTLPRLFGDHGRPDLFSYKAASFVAAAIALLTALLAWLLPGRPETVRSPELAASEIEEGRLAAAGLEDLTELPGAGRPGTELSAPGLRGTELPASLAEPDRR